jgi:two-component system cell cycle response regulator DivK
MMRSDPRPNARRWTDAGSDARRRRCARVLIVEDDDDGRCLLRCLLEADGFEVVEAADGAAGLAAARGTQPDVIIIDGSLPIKDGWTVVRELRHDTPAVAAAIVFVTGHGDADSEARARAAGCDYFLSKPYDVDALHCLIRLAARTRVMKHP